MKKFRRKVLDMLMSNNSGSSLRQQLLDGAPFRSSLLYTAIPQRAASGTTGTFTRATTSTWPNNDGYMVTGVAGEIGFVGARRVRNLVTKSEDLTSGWAANNAGSVTATTITFTAASNDGWNVTGLTVEAGRTYLWSALMSATSGTKNVRFRCGGGALSSNIGLTTTPTRVSAVFTAVTAGATNGIYNESGGGAATVNCTEMQLEDITGRTDQTTPSEYVSVGVESAPYYHGSFVDGVKCYSTDINGAAIPSSTLLGYQAEGARTNLCLQSQTIATAPWQIGNGIAVTADQYVAPDGTTTMDKLTAIAGNTQHFWYQELTTTAAVHTYSVYLRYVNNQWARIGVYDGVGSFYAAFDILNGVVGSTLGAVTATAIEPMGDGVTWRVSLTATLAANALSQVYLSVVNADDPSFGLWNAVGTEAIGAWGAQVELGSFASSYIPTTTIAVTRNADVLTYSSAGNIDGTKGWCYAEVNGSNVSYLSTDGAYYVTSDTSSDSPILYNVPVPPGKLSTFDGTSIINGDAITANIKGCVSWGGTSRSISVNGGTPVSGAFDGAIITGSSIGIGHKVGGITSAYANIGPIYIGQRQLSASELQAITS